MNTKTGEILSVDEIRERLLTNLSKEEVDKMTDRQVCKRAGFDMPLTDEQVAEYKPLSREDRIALAKHNRALDFPRRFKKRK